MDATFIDERTKNEYDLLLEEVGKAARQGDKEKALELLLVMDALVFSEIDTLKRRLQGSMVIRSTLATKIEFLHGSEPTVKERRKILNNYMQEGRKTP